MVNDSDELINLTNKLLSISTTDEVGALSAIANSAEFLCTNTHYPNIPLHDYVGINGATYSLRLLLDFGFIPSYPKGGTYSYDISNKDHHTMILTSTSNIIYEAGTASGLNCLGGCLKFDNSTSLDYGYIPYVSDLYPLSTSVNTWIKVQSTSSNRCIIDTTNGWPGFGLGTGYQLWINGDQVTVIVLTSTGIFTWSSTAGLISPDTWYNITFTISPDVGNNNTNVVVIVSDYANYDIASRVITEPGSQGGNTNDFVIGVRKTTPATNPFDSYISLVSIYEGALAYADIEQLWSAYTQCNPKPDNPSGFVGRYATY